MTGRRPLTALLVCGLLGWGLSPPAQAEEPWSYAALSAPNQVLLGTLAVTGCSLLLGSGLSTAGVALKYGPNGVGLGLLGAGVLLHLGCMIAGPALFASWMAESFSGSAMTGGWLVGALPAAVISVFAGAYAAIAFFTASPGNYLLTSVPLFAVSALPTLGALIGAQLTRGQGEPELTLGFEPREEGAVALVGLRF